MYCQDYEWGRFQKDERRIYIFHTNFEVLENHKEESEDNITCMPKIEFCALWDLIFVMWLICKILTLHGNTSCPGLKNVTFNISYKSTILI